MFPVTQEPTQEGRGNRRWIVIAVVALVVIAICAAVLFVISGGKDAGTAPIEAPGILTPSLPLSVETSAPSLALNLSVNLLGLGLVGLFVFSLLECEAQGDNLMLDFFAAWGLVLLFVLGQIYGFTGNQLFAGLIGVGIAGMFIATFLNPTQESEPAWFNRVDTTHWYVLGLALIFIYLMRSASVPYPTYIPIIAPITVTILALSKEFFRQTQFSLMATAVGFVCALLQEGWLALGLAVVLVIAILANKQGWATTRGTSHNLSLGGRTLRVFIAWDVVLFYIAEVVLVGYALYGNYAVLVITR